MGRDELVNRWYFQPHSPALMRFSKKNLLSFHFTEEETEPGEPECFVWGLRPRSRSVRSRVLGSVDPGRLSTALGLDGPYSLFSFLIWA